MNAADGGKSLRSVPKIVDVYFPFVSCIVFIAILTGSSFEAPIAQPNVSIILFFVLLSVVLLMSSKSTEWTYSAMFSAMVILFSSNFLNYRLCHPLCCNRILGFQVVCNILSLFYNFQHRILQ